VELINVGRSHFEPERQRLITLATELGVKDAIHFLEDVPEHDLPLLYNLADVYVTPSLYEGFGFPIVEAMACGTPVVYAKAGSMPEIVGNGGVEVSPRDVARLADALLALLTNRERRLALRRSGHEQAAGFTWSEAVRRTMATYLPDPNEVLAFLRLPSYGHGAEWARVHVGEYGAAAPAATRSLLRDFYRPHNEALYRLLDHDFAWS